MNSQEQPSTLCSQIRLTVNRGQVSCDISKMEKILLINALESNSKIIGAKKKMRTLHPVLQMANCSFWWRWLIRWNRFRKALWVLELHLFIMVQVFSPAMREVVKAIFAGTLSKTIGSKPLSNYLITCFIIQVSPPISGFWATTKHLTVKEKFN